MSDTKPITGELRKYATVSWDPWPDARDRLYKMCDRIDAIHAGLERENAELRAARGDDWIKLPVDADGLPIHVGDMLRYVDEVIECAAITPKRVYFWREHEMHWTPGINCRHYQPDTWESIIYDAVAAGRTDKAVDLSPIIRRCKALAGEDA